MIVAYYSVGLIFLHFHVTLKVLRYLWYPYKDLFQEWISPIKEHHTTIYLTAKRENKKFVRLANVWIFFQKYFLITDLYCLCKLIFFWSCFIWPLSILFVQPYSGYMKRHRHNNLPNEFYIKCAIETESISLHPYFKESENVDSGQCSNDNRLFKNLF